MLLVVITMLLSSILFVIPNSRANEVSTNLGTQAENYADEIMKVHLEEVKKHRKAKKYLKQF